MTEPHVKPNGNVILTGKEVLSYDEDRVSKVQHQLLWSERSGPHPTKPNETFVMFNSPRLQPVVAGQRQRASVSGWPPVLGTGCDQKPASEQEESELKGNINNGNWKTLESLQSLQLL